MLVVVEEVDNLDMLVQEDKVVEELVQILLLLLVLMEQMD
jgi:hypothetical protein